MASASSNALSIPSSSTLVDAKAPLQSTAASPPWWEKVEDKHAVSTLAVSGLVGVVGSAGLVSAIDRLPLITGTLEAVSIGYSGCFAYKYLLFKPDRDAMLKKVKEKYKEILGIS